MRRPPPPPLNSKNKIKQRDKHVKNRNGWHTTFPYQHRIQLSTSLMESMGGRLERWPLMENEPKSWLEPRHEIIPRWNDRTRWKSFAPLPPPRRKRVPEKNRNCSKLVANGSRNNWPVYDARRQSWNVRSLNLSFRKRADTGNPGRGFQNEWKTRQRGRRKIWRIRKRTVAEFQHAGKLSQIGGGLLPNGRNKRLHVSGRI